MLRVSAMFVKEEQAPCRRVQPTTTPGSNSRPQRSLRDHDGPVQIVEENKWNFGYTKLKAVVPCWFYINFCEAVYNQVSKRDIHALFVMGN